MASKKAFAYYNEFGPAAAAWLRELIANGLIAPGEVDERSIIHVQPEDLKGFTQHHFFAGIGVWSHALRQAGWPDDRPVWTGSCPCQPFSSAGKGKGTADERHLWPELFRLIAICRPRVVFGEQVASKDGLAWLDIVQADLESANYASAALDLCAAGFGAPHIRQRIYFVGERVGQPGVARLERLAWDGNHRHEPRWNGEGAGRSATTTSGVGGLADAQSVRSGQGRPHAPGRSGRDSARQKPGLGSPVPHGGSGAINGFWGSADWLFCRDERWRPIEPGIEPLVNGPAARVVRLRGYGNAIVAPVAKAFIEAYIAFAAANPE